MICYNQLDAPFNSRDVAFSCEVNQQGQRNRAIWIFSIMFVFYIIFISLQKSHVRMSSDQYSDVIIPRQEATSDLHHTTRSTGNGTFLFKLIEQWLIDTGELANRFVQKLPIRQNVYN